MIVRREGIDGIPYLYDTVSGDWKYLSSNDELATTRSTKGWKELTKIADCHNNTSTATTGTGANNCNCSHCKQKRVMKASLNASNILLGYLLKYP
jgi:hypothetical protein